jgi:hypothetical protein
MTTCIHIYDNGGTCNSPAVTGQRFCPSHLHHRARLMRIAQVRARNQRLDLKLPPIESMATVLSAINQLVEAVAADMLDLKRADFLLKSLRFAAQALKQSDKTPSSGAPSSGAPPLSPAVGDRVGSVDLAAEYGLPPDLDLTTPPEVAFPPPASISSDLSSRAERSGVEGLGFSLSSRAERSGVEGPAFDLPSPAQQPEADPFIAALRRDGILGDLEFRPDYPVTPEYVEMDEIRRTLGSEASVARSTQMMRNERRRRLRTERKRYAKIAAQINLQRAADQLAERKLAERAAQQTVSVGGPQLPDVGNCGEIGCPTPASFAGVGVLSTDESAAAKKPPVATTGETIATKEATTA